MVEKQRTLSRTRVAIIALAVSLVYCVGYGLQVAGWRLVESNGGNAGPYPAFFPQPSVGIVLAIGLSALSAFLLARRNAATR